jgi:sugar O-acyltransferase (sialic acid O-acetyltransferase NeuD family)
MKAVLFGTGVFAQYIAYVLAHDSAYEISAYCVDEAYLGDQESFDGKPIISFNNLERYYPPSEYHLFIALGNSRVRAERFSEALRKGYTLPSYVSSKANTWNDLVVGSNVFVLEGCILQPFFTVGDNSILMGVKGGHHTRVGSHCLLSGSFLGGGAVISDHCFLGLDSVVKEDVTVGPHNIIGMGAHIHRDTGADEVFTSESTTRKRAVSASRIRGRFL